MYLNIHITFQISQSSICAQTPEPPNKTPTVVESFPFFTWHSRRIIKILDFISVFFFGVVIRKLELSYILNFLYATYSVKFNGVLFWALTTLLAVVLWTPSSAHLAIWKCVAVCEICNFVEGKKNCSLLPIIFPNLFTCLPVPSVEKAPSQHDTATSMLLCGECN